MDMEKEVLSIIKNNTLTYQMKVISLAKLAENSINILNISDDIKNYMDEGVICDLWEGNAPYRPRYIVPDYEKFMVEGSEFLGIKPPTNIWEATHSLLMLYKHVPSVTTFPVYVGNLDTLLEPFVKDEEEAYNAIKLFLMHIDRTITDSFCHANIGPMDTKAGRLILKAERELQNSTPNITLKVAENTPDELMVEAVNTALSCAKPSFANHEMFTSDLGNYAIASCYNGLNIGGGSYTLVRLNLAKLAPKAKNIDEFMNELLPKSIQSMLELMDVRVNFIVEESGFFESNFLVKEGFLNKDNFTAMFGMVGLADAVNYFVGSEKQEDRFGYSKEANDLGIEIIEKMQEVVNLHTNEHCKATDGKYVLHAQVGLDSDKGVAPGCRIPIGEEPPIHEHLIQSAPYHKYFPSGIGDIFKFDETAKRNPKAIVDIVRGAFKLNLRYISLYCADCDVIRITGYLVKRSDIEKLEKNEQVLNDTVVLGYGAAKNAKILERRLRKNEE
ncbi:YjjI family glycine radical enzyme [Clostridium sp. CTA-19]